MIRTRTAELQSQLSRTARDRLKMTPRGKILRFAQDDTRGDPSLQ